MNLYLSNTGCDGPAAWQGSWNLDGQVTLALTESKAGWIPTTATRAETSATNPFRVGVLRGVSPDLSPQTISGTLDVVLGISESNIAADFFWRLHVFVWNATDDTVLGTLLSGYEESSGGGGTEWPTTNTGRALQAAQTLTNVVVPNDGKAYRVVAELGYISYNSSTTSRTGTIRFGAVASNGSSEFADLTVGSTSTSTLAGFLTFSSTLTFVAATVTNLGASSATALGALPAATAQNIRDDGAAHTVWYSFTAPSSGVVGVYGYGDFTPVYEPQVYALIGPLGSLVPVGGTIGTFRARNVPIQFPVTSGTTYFIRFVPAPTSGTLADNPNPATLTLDVRMFMQVAVPAAPFLIPDDLDGFPAAVLDPTTGDPLAYILDFPAGESGYNQRSNGFILTEDEGDSDLALFSPNGALPNITEVAAVPLSVSTTFFGGISGNKSNRFYVGNGSTVSAVDLTGAIVDTWTVTGNAWALTPNLDDTILYYNGQTAPVTIHRWDLVNDVALSDLASLPSVDDFSFRQMLTLADGTILLGGSNNNIFTPNYTVWRYSPAGVLLNTYDFSAQPLHGGFALLHQIFESLNDPTDFWVWLKIYDDIAYVGNADNVKSRFLRVQTSSGTILEQFDADIFEEGVFSGVPVLAAPRFGHSNSCPAFQWLVGDVPPPPAPSCVEGCPIDFSPGPGSAGAACGLGLDQFGFSVGADSCGSLGGSGEGAAGLTLGATGVGASDFEGGGDAALLLGGGGDGRRSSLGDGDAALTLGAQGAGEAVNDANGSGVADLVLGATGEGTRTSSGAGTAALTLGLVGVGDAADQPPPPSGFGTSSLTLGAAGVGQTQQSGSGTAALTLGGTGVGKKHPKGKGTIPLSLSLTGAGDAPNDPPGPFITALTLASPSPTPAGSAVEWTLLFNEAVTGVTLGAFTLVESGVSGSALIGLSGSGASYTVMATLGSGGGGTVGLTLSTPTGIRNAALVELVGTPFVGESYTVGTVTVDAGADLTFALPQTTITLFGRGTNTADPSTTFIDSLLFLWELVSGPAAVTFSASWAHHTQVTLTTPGTYVFRLSAMNAGGSFGSDTVTVTLLSAASQTAFYVDPSFTGGGNNGSATNPWTTIAFDSPGSAPWNAINAALASNNVVVYFSARHAGSDTPETENSPVNMWRTDTSSHRLTFDGQAKYNTNDTVGSWLDYGGSNKFHLAGNGACSIGVGTDQPNYPMNYTTIRRFDCSVSRVLWAGSHIRIELCDVHDIVNGGATVQFQAAVKDFLAGCTVLFGNCTDITFSQNTIARGYGEAFYVAGTYTRVADGGCLNWGNTHSNILVEGNTLTYVAGQWNGEAAGGQPDGMDYKAGLTYLTVRGNTLTGFPVGVAAITCSGLFYTDATPIGHYLFETNRLVDNVGGLVLQKQSGCVVRNNVSDQGGAFSSSGDVDDAFWRSHNIRYYNNTLYNAFILAQYADDVRVFNNLIFNWNGGGFGIGSIQGNSTATNVTEDYNVYDTAAPPQQVTSGGHSVGVSSPYTNLVTNAGAGDFTLPSSSAARGAGIPLPGFAVDIVAAARVVPWTVGAYA